MKLFPTVVLVLTGSLVGTACQSNHPKPESVSVESGSTASTAAGAGMDTPAAPQLDPNVQYLKEQLNLTVEQAKKLTEIFQDTSAQRKALHAQRIAQQPAQRKAQRAAWSKQVRELQKKKLERINGVLTAEQAKKYEQIRSEPPAEVMEAQPSSESQPPQPMK